MAETIYLGNVAKKIEVNIPDYFGNLSLYEVVWIKPIRDSFVEVSLKSKEVTSFTIWLCQVVNGCIFPISCTVYIEEDERKFFNLLKSLNLSKGIIMNRIIDERIKVCLKTTM